MMAVGPILAGVAMLASGGLRGPFRLFLGVPILISIIAAVVNAS